MHKKLLLNSTSDKLKDHFDMQMRQLSIRKGDVPFNYFTNNGFKFYQRIYKIDWPQNVSDVVEKRLCMVRF